MFACYLDLDEAESYCGRLDGLPMTSCLLVLPWHLHHSGGVNEVVKSLLRNVAASGEFNSLILVTSSDLDAKWDAAQPFSTFYEPLPGPLERPRRIRSLLSFLYRLPSRLLRLRKLLQETRVGAVNPHYPHLGILHFSILRALRLFNGSLVLSFHLSDAHNANSTSGLERWLWRWLLSSADRIVTPTCDLYEPLLSIAPGIRSKLVTINNGVDFALCSSRPQDLDRFPPELVGKPVILSIGNFEARKGHDIVMRALVQVRRKWPSAALVIVGAARPYLSELERLRADLGMEGAVFFFENVPHEMLPCYLSRASLFALATESETFCLALLEAGAAGLPIVSTKAPGVVEVIKDGDTGRLVAVGDAHALAEAILETLDHPKEAAQRAAVFRQEIRDHLTWDHHYQKYQALYCQLREGVTRRSDT
jgi:glycosyltransferase involved in cell wall biosynthesis